MENVKLYPPEIDFIEFLSKKRNQSEEKIKNEYLSLRKEFNFETNEFKEFGIKIYKMDSIYFSDDSDGSLIRSYKHHALMHLLRFLSYEKAHSEKSSNKLKTAINLLAKGDLSKFTKQTKRNLTKKTERLSSYDFDSIADHIYKNTTSKISAVVDYGCGPGFISFALSKKINEITGVAGRYPKIKTPFLSLFMIPHVVL